jgi:hypothetical protein
LAAPQPGGPVGGLRQLPWGGHGLAFEDVGEEIGIVRGQGVELVEERLLGLQLPAERKARVAVHNSLQVARPGATHSEIAVGRIVAGCRKFNLGRQKFTDGFACKLFC